MKKKNEKQMYAAQGLTEPVVYHKHAGREVSWQLSAEEKESWQDLAGDNWNDTVIESLEYFGDGKKLHYVSNRYDKNATLKSKTIHAR
jgi:predicted HNH restriction endonuclease